MALALLTSQQHKWARDGFIIIQICSRDEALALKKEMCDRLASVGDAVDAVGGGTPATTGISVWFPRDVPSCFEKVLMRGVLPRAISELCGGAPIDFLSTKPVYKSGVVTYASPWHQDYEYWGGTPKISGWIAVDNSVVGNGCLKVIPASHHFGELPHNGDTSDGLGFVNRINPASLEPLLASRCDADGGPSTLADAVFDCEITAGSAIIFSDLLLHASNPNMNGADRYSMIPTYRRADVEDASTTWETSVPTIASGSDKEHEKASK